MSGDNSEATPEVRQVDTGRSPARKKPGDVQENNFLENTANENKFIFVLIIGIVGVFLISQYINNVIYGSCIIALYVAILNILSRRWNVSEGSFIQDWFVRKNSRNRRRL